MQRGLESTRPVDKKIQSTYSYRNKCSVKVFINVCEALISRCDMPFRCKCDDYFRIIKIIPQLGCRTGGVSLQVEINRVMKGDNLNFWQKYARLYGPLMAVTGKDYYRSLCEDITRNFSGSERALELACGSGQLSFMLARRCASLIATDFSENMIAEARRKDDGSIAGLSFDVKDATSTGYPSSSFDVVVIANALHIMPDPEAVMSEISRILKPGGRLFAPTFVLNEGKGFRPFVKLISLFGFKAFRKWTRGDLVAFVQAHGFRVTSSRLRPSGVSPLAEIEAIRDL